MKFEFSKIAPITTTGSAIPSSTEWNSWIWQMQNRLNTKDDFSKFFALTASEEEALKNQTLFKTSCTPYYAKVAKQSESLRATIIPHAEELTPGTQQMDDPLAERKNLKSEKRLVHRYSDRVLFLITDTCSAYCRYCFRKYFTGHDQGYVGSKEYQNALKYIQSKPGIREVILSGGDPLTLSNNLLDRVLSDLRKIEHIEIIRLGSRMPAFCPMRVDQDLLGILKKYKPVYFMSHMNHPKELTQESAQALEALVDHGVPVLNQAVLLNGVNNHAAIIQALNRRLVFLRVKPYYLFQCDPSIGTDHFRTPIETGERIQRELWGHLSGIAMANHSLDIPGVGGKTTFTPDFTIEKTSTKRVFEGWDGSRGEYINPTRPEKTPDDLKEYLKEWEELKSSRDERNCLN